MPWLLGKGLGHWCGVYLLSRELEKAYDFNYIGIRYLNP